ncbi:hypothetical protein JRI60_29310 [Archangium violaceum]|uniref:hypothetical protein n=1 Tax=Archangium violaceum TaxID=83451 RepID=UPI00194FB827|nr:hypothetical protein [Archangium violaceum]QRN93288.1 hypothetical protein JRI60_29310 [Archangium violaceum]
MLKRFESAVGVLVMALALAACQPPEGEQLQSNEGEAQMVVRGLSSYNITRVVVTARPANVSKTLDYNPDTGAFSGRLLLPAGEQTLTAEGYSSYGVDGGSQDGGYPDGGSVDAGSSDGGYMDAGSSTEDGGWTDAGRPVDGGSFDGGPTTGDVLVAAGSATVTVVANSTTAVTLRIHDITPPPPQGDIGPLIYSMTSSRSDLTVGASTQLEVNAVDLDGDPLFYTWTSNCPSGTFTSPYAATTSWSSSAPGVCKLSVTVSSRAQSVTESVDVTVFSAPVDGGPGEGSVQVNGEYIARPNIYGLYVTGPGVPGVGVSRSSPNATLPNMQAGAMYFVEMQLDFGTRFGAFEKSLESDCGGSWMLSWDSCATNGYYCSVSYYWTAPASGAVCKLTARAANSGLGDSFSVGVVVK